MKRREFLKALSALPLLGFLKPELEEPEYLQSADDWYPANAESMDLQCDSLRIALFRSTPESFAADFDANVDQTLHWWHALEEFDGITEQ